MNLEGLRAFLGTTRGRLALVFLPVALAYLALLFQSRGAVRLEKGVELTELQIPATAPIGGTFPLALTFTTPAGLDPETWVFLHIEATGEGAEHNCRIIHDRPAPVALTSAGFAGPLPVVHKVDVPVAASCKPAKFRVFAGLWNRATGSRLAVLEPKTLDQRLQVASLELLPAGSAAEPAATVSASKLKRRIMSMLFEPWLGGGAGLLAAAVLAVLLGKRLTEKPDDGPKLPMEIRWGSFALPATALVLGILVVLEFVKDDAYISFRYAHNFVKGQGLVFNPGERLEGYTNFLWTLLLVPFEALGWDLFQVCEVLGTIISIGVIVLLTFHTIKLDEERRELTQLWAGMWLATSSSWVLWAKSGLEQSLAIGGVPGPLPGVPVTRQREVRQRLLDRHGEPSR